MIKKGYLIVKKRLQTLPLYWKTWIITTITLVMTLIIFFLVFSLFATKFLENNQQNKFNRSTEEILEKIEQHGVNEAYLNPYMIEGYSIFILSGEQVIYPINSAIFSVIYSDEEIPTTTTIELNEIQGESAGLNTRRTVTYEGSELAVDIYYPAIVNPGEITSTLVAIIPYFVLIGLLVAFGVSWLYSRYFTAKISHLNNLVHEMSTSSISSNYESQKGDELQELKNNVYHMYQELQITLKQLNQEMDRVHQLESDRQVFMRGATHELKTPIMAMMTSISGMMENVAGYEDKNTHLSQCYNRLQSMSRLVNEMLEISRLEGVVFSGETNLTQTTIDMLEVYDYMIQDQHLEIKLNQIDQLKLKIPERTLQKVISNLIGNSVKYSPYGSTINIESHLSYWEIRNSVKDLKIIDLDTIFDPFISYDRDEELLEKSHGLGLYIVSAILKQYGYKYDCFIEGDKQEFIFKILK